MKYVLMPLKLGYSILCNGLIHSLSRDEKLIVPALPYNRDSIEFMFFDNYNVIVDYVRSEQDMIDHSVRLNTIGLGHYSKDKFDTTKFDQEFYRQACVPFEERWNSFKVPKEENKKLEFPPIKYNFIHEDIDRGFQMSSLVSNNPCFRPDSGMAKNIFDYVKVIRAADEVHCINSSFLCMIDSLQGIDGKLFYHRYARGGIAPILKKKWNVID